MDWSARTPSQWDYESLALLGGSTGEMTWITHSPEWGAQNGSMYSSGGGVCSGSDLGNGASSKSSLSASIDSALRAWPRASIISFDAARKDPVREDSDRGMEIRNTPELGDAVGPVEPLMGLKLGKRIYFEDVYASENMKNVSQALPTPSSATSKKSRVSNQSSQKSCCQVDGCNVDLTTAKSYHRKHRVCENHSKCPVVVIAGQERRFCQQCSRFHGLSEFDQRKRSCRRRLYNHNARRRKPHPHAISCNSSRLSSPFCGPEAPVVASGSGGAPDFRRALSLLSTDSWGSAPPVPTSIDHLVHVNHTNVARTALQVTHPISDYWQASVPQEGRLRPYPLRSDAGRFQLLKEPCGTAFPWF